MRLPLVSFPWFPVSVTFRMLDLTQATNILSNIEFWPNIAPHSLSEAYTVFAWFTCLAILAVNIPVLWILKNKCEATAINLFIGIDCIICILNILPVLNMYLEWQTGSLYLENTELFCCLTTTTMFLVSLLNRLLPVGIVAFRYVFICQSQLVLTADQRKTFNKILIISTTCLPVILSVCSLVYREKYLHYLRCLGRWGSPHELNLSPTELGLM